MVDSTDVTAPPAGYAVVAAGAARGRRRALTRSASLLAQRSLGRSPRPALPQVALAAAVEPDVEGLAAYQEVVGAATGDNLPAGYVHALGFPLALELMTRADFPVPALGMVHVANSVTQRRPFVLGEEIAFTAWAADLRPHRRGALLDVWLLARAAGEPAWTGVTTYLATGVRLGAAGLPPGVVDQPDAESEDQPGDDGADREMPGRHLWRLPADTGRRYAAVSGDPNPIHTSRVAARAFGFRRPIAHGMYCAARALAEIRPAAAFTWEVDFLRPVLLPATVVFEFGRAGNGCAFTGRATGKEHFSGRITAA